MKENIEKILEFEMDANNFPRITEKNVKLIDFIIKNDSNYRSDNDEHNKLSTLCLVNSYKNNPTKENLEKVIKAIDKQNSTHLSSSGKKKGSNKGIRLTLEYIYKNSDKIITSIQNGDIKVVEDIAQNAIEKRYIISFASKFCTYMSRYMFNGDSFSIYDSVLVDILPYYYYQYVRKDIKLKITKNKIKQNGYGWYSNIIDEIINNVKKHDNYNVSRKDFDHLLWYYYKGDKDIKDTNGNICHKSRTKQALESIK